MNNENLKLTSESILSELSKMEIVLLSGGAQSGRSSLAFSICYEFAMFNKSEKSLYMGNRLHLESNFPICLITGYSDTQNWAPNILSAIEIKYTTDIVSLRKIFSALHLWSIPPSFIVIDNLESMVDPLHLHDDHALFQQLSSIGAIIADTMEYFRNKFKKDFRVMIVIDSNRPQYIKALSTVPVSLWNLDATGSQLKIVVDGSRETNPSCRLYHLHSPTEKP